MKRARKQFLADEEEEEYIMSYVMGLGVAFAALSLHASVRGSRPEKAPNIDRRRHYMHIQADDSRLFI
jgi:hypothetical protein